MPGDGCIGYSALSGSLFYNNKCCPLSRSKIIAIGGIGSKQEAASGLNLFRRLKTDFISRIWWSWETRKLDKPGRFSSEGKLSCRASHDDEFKSTRSIALGLHRRYKDVLNGGFTNLKEFVEAGVTAYAVGCTAEGLRNELLSVCESENLETPAGSVRLKNVTAEEVEDCILWLCIVFLTIMCTPQPTVVRWSSFPAVSSEQQRQWKGFCAVIANAYYTRGMAWMPIKTLQLEQLAVAGHAEEPALVADRMRLVFATLESVSPQWPKQ